MSTADAAAVGQPAAVPKSVQDALLRYRFIAYVVGVGLIILVLIGVPLRYGAGIDGVVAVVGPLHGVLYIVYLLLTLDLARRVRLNPIVTVLAMAAGTIPFLSFVAEYKVRHIVLHKEQSTNPHAADTRL